MSAKLSDFEAARIPSQGSRRYSEAATYYTQIDPELGRRFFAEMERLIESIRREPQVFHRFDPPAQRNFSSIFPYAVIYVEQSDQIWILALMHMKRRPGYWKNRI